MITPTNPITIPEQNADGLWISSINIIAPSASAPVRAVVRVTPYNSTSSAMFPALAKNIIISDVMATASVNMALGAAMQSIFVAVQDMVTTQSLF